MEAFGGEVRLLEEHARHLSSMETGVVAVSHCVDLLLPCRDFRSSFKDFQICGPDAFISHLHPKNTPHGSGLPPRRKDQEGEREEGERARER